ncbi:MAG: ribonuclease P protein component [bacterium]
MLPKTQRVTKTLFPELLGKGVFCSSATFSARLLSSPTLKCSVVVSKKAAGTAVLRNRLKRRFAAALENVLSVVQKNGSLKAPFMGAFFVKVVGGKAVKGAVGGAKEVPLPEIEAEILALLKKVKLV